MDWWIAIEMITMRAESLASWQRGCLEHQAVAQSLSLDVINYSLRRIAGIPDATASSTSASAADGKNPIACMCVALLCDISIRAFACILAPVHLPHVV